MSGASKSMSKSRIHYADYTWNPVVGCEPDFGCYRRCWARAMHRRYFPGEPFTPHFKPEQLPKILHTRNPGVVACCFGGDLFASGITRGQQYRVFDYSRSLHVVLWLTKRPNEMRDFIGCWMDHEGDQPHKFFGARGPADVRAKHTSRRAMLFADGLESMGEPPEGCAYPTYDWMEGPIGWPDVFHNIYLGTSWMTEVDDYRLDPMYNLHHRRWNTWISIEPIVGPPSDKLLGNIRHGTFKWVVLGCESGAGARRMDYEWALSIREACIDGRTSFFYKQGPGSSDDGRTHEEVVFGHKTIDVPLLDGRSWTQAPWRS